jgi:hypothetical protein
VVFLRAPRLHGVQQRELFRFQLFLRSKLLDGARNAPLPLRRGEERVREAASNQVDVHEILVRHALLAPASRHSFDHYVCGSVTEYGADRAGVVGQAVGKSFGVVAR